MQGKSFIPLLSAYACAVPAILATRTIENKRDRIATILIAPFMTCSARLPVYTLMIAAFLPERPLLGPVARDARGGHAGPLPAGLSGGVRHGAAAEVFGAEERAGRLRAGNAALPLAHLAVAGAAPAGSREGVPAARRHGDPGGRRGRSGCLAHLPLHDGKPPRIEQSLAGSVGRAIEPAIRPLGFNWKIGVGLVTSLAAREVIVGTLGTIYGMDPDARALGLQRALRQDLTPGRRRGPAGLLRLRHAVHVHGGRGAPGNGRLEVAR